MARSDGHIQQRGRLMELIDVVISEDDEIDAKTNTVKFVAVKR